MKLRLVVLLFFTGVSLFILSGCIGGHREAVSPAVDYSGELVNPSDIEANFVWRQEISAEFGGRQQGFSAVLQKDGTQLTVLGLTPFGTRAFLLEQVGQDIKFTSYLDRPIPFPPRAILIDIHRSLFLAMPKRPAPDGLFTQKLNNETIADSWRGGRLRTRTYSAPDRAKLIIIRYKGGMVPGEPPKSFTFENGWYGYTLTVNTLSTQKLSSPAASTDQASDTRR